MDKTHCSEMVLTQLDDQHSYKKKLEIIVGKQTMNNIGKLSRKVNIKKSNYYELPKTHKSQKINTT